MMNIKGIFAVSLIAMVAMVAGAHTSNAVAAIASQGYVDQQVGSKANATDLNRKVDIYQGDAKANQAVITNGTGNITTGFITKSMLGADVEIPAAIKVDSALSSTSTNPVQNKVINTALNAKEVTSNKVTSTNYDANVSSDTKYPTVKAVADAIADVEKKIPAAIKVDSALSSTSTNPVQNKVINTALAGKQATLTSTQLDAVNSGITSTKVSTYDEYNEKITAAQNAADAAASAAATAQQTANGKVTANAAITARTATKITYDAKGLVTGGASLTASDIPTISSDKISGLATVATTGSYGDLTGTPTIPTVNNATLTIQKNGSTVDTFTANASANKTINITVPTQTSQLTNNSGFITADDLPVATANTLGGVKSGGDITVDTSGAVTVNSASRADSATTATNAKTAATDAEGNNIILTYATKSQITALDSTSEGTGAVVTNVSQKDGKVSVTKGNVQIPVGSATATTYATIWVQ